MAQGPVLVGGGPKGGGVCGAGTGQGFGCHLGQARTYQCPSETLQEAQTGLRRSWWGLPQLCVLLRHGPLRAQLPAAELAGGATEWVVRPVCWAHSSAQPCAEISDRPSAAPHPGWGLLCPRSLRATASRTP